jgi:GNAT superfamily N-acetyltransferase
MKLVTTSPEEIQNYDPMWFPLAQEYFHPSKGGLYLSDEAVWMDAIEEGQNPPVVGVVCLMVNRILPLSLHISVLEVRADLKSKGLGTKIMEYIEDVADMFGPDQCRSITLQCRYPTLVNFYSKFGFKRSCDQHGIKFMRKYLTN